MIGTPLPRKEIVAYPNDLIRQFRKAMQDVGITYFGEIIADGKFHRFHIEDHKPSSKNGAYVLYTSSHPVGYFKDFRSGIEQRWRYKSGSTRVSPELKLKSKQANRQREIEQHNCYESAAAQAVHIWEFAPPISNQSAHFYLINKKIQPNGTRLKAGYLLIPIYDKSNHLVSLQTISPTGKKRFLSGGRKQGCFYRIGELTDTLLICEGFATGVSLYEESGKQVIIAFDAGNLLPVAKNIRELSPDSEIIICGDNDLTGVGQKKAIDAALAVGGKVKLPPIPGMDWNDYLTMEKK